MYNTNRSVTRNGNQGSPRQAGLHAAASGKGVGNSSANASALGARSEQSKGACLEASTLHSGRRQGGQASIGLFGIPGVSRTGTEATAPVEEAAPEAKAPTRQHPPVPRVVHGQTYRQRARRYSAGIMAGAIAASQASHAATVTVPAAGVALPLPKCWQPADAHAMREAAAIADERDRQPAPDLEEWERTLPFGYTEVLLAQD